MRSTWVLVVGLLLVPLAGCITDEDAQESRCSDWVLDQAEDHDHEARLYIRNERSTQVCVKVHFGGQAVVKVPMDAAEDGQAVEVERTVPWSERRFTVRAEDWRGEAWSTQTVDLAEAPHLVVTFVEEDVRIQAHAEPPST